MNATVARAMVSIPTASTTAAVPHHPATTGPMTDTEPPEEDSASATEPLRWPDPSRPIINEQPSPGYLPSGPLRRDRLPSVRSWRQRAIAATLVILVLILVAVWLLWWR